MAFTKAHFRLTAVLLLLMVLPSLLFPDSASVAVPPAAPSITILEPDGYSDVLAEGDDFATTVPGMPWDMNSSPYPDFPTVMGNFERSSFSVGGGVWDGITTGSDSSIFIHPTGLAQPVMKDGSRFPIDTSKYRLLSFRMYSSHSDLAQVLWFYDSTYTKFAGSNFFTASSGWNTYVVDLATIGTNTLIGGATGWNGMVKGLRIDPVAGLGAGVNIKFDWIRLTPLATSYSYQITWSASNASDVVLHLDTDNFGCDGTRISNSRSASSGSFNWGASIIPNVGASQPYPMPYSLEPGRYYVYAVLNGDPGTCTYSDGPLTISHAPTVEISRPSRSSGPDYATAVAGNAWEMNGPPDVAIPSHLTWYEYSGGMFHGTSDSSGDPSLILNAPSPIDTNPPNTAYRYLTFRMVLDGFQDIGVGSVARALWWGPSGPGNAGTTLDIVVYEGYQTYTLDLSQALLSQGPAWTTSNWTTFRLDPHEFPIARTFHLDDVLLTANDRANHSFGIKWCYDNGGEDEDLLTNLYYDTDTSWANGKTFIAQLAPGGGPGSPCADDYCVYLPLVMNSYDDVGMCRHYNWDTGAVPAGTYYIWVEVTDGYNTTHWVSDGPVVISH
jgi:hypothetical protein